MERIWVECSNESLFAFFRILFGEEPIIHADFYFFGMFRRDPMNRRFDFASIGRISAARGWIICRMNFQDFTCIILHHMRAFDEIRVAQADFIAWIQTEIFGWWRFAEVV